MPARCEAVSEPVRAAKSATFPIGSIVVQIIMKSRTIFWIMLRFAESLRGFYADTRAARRGGERSGPVEPSADRDRRLLDREDFPGSPDLERDGGTRRLRGDQDPEIHLSSARLLRSHRHVRLRAGEERELGSRQDLAGFEIRHGHGAEKFVGTIGL